MTDPGREAGWFEPGLAPLRVYIPPGVPVAGVGAPNDRVQIDAGMWMKEEEMAGGKVQMGGQAGSGPSGGTRLLTDSTLPGCCSKVKASK